MDFLNEEEKNEENNNIMMILDEIEEIESTETQFDLEYIEEDILPFMPQIVQYRVLGGDWIAERNNITDAFLMPLCNEVARLPMKSLGEQWEDQKKRKIDNYIEIKNEVVNEVKDENILINNIDKLYTE
jgi:hypothetical protein